MSDDGPEDARGDVEAISAPAILTDPVAGTVARVNRAARSLLGAAAEEIVGRDVTSLLSPADRVRIPRGCAAIAAGVVEGIQVVLRMRGPSGSELPVTAWGRRAIQGERAFVLWLLMPMSAHRETPVDAAPEPELVVAVTDHDWLLQYVSAGAALLGLPAGGLVGASLLGLVHPSSIAEFVSATSAVSANGLPMSVATRLKSGAGEWLDRHCIIAALCHHQPPRLGVVVAANTTMTERVKAVSASPPSSTDQPNVRVAGAAQFLRGQQRTPELSARQFEVLVGVVEGRSPAEIAEYAYLSVSTVRNHLSAIYRKFGVRSRAELLAHILRDG